MFYRIRIDLAFTNISNLNKVAQLVDPFLKNAVIINPGHLNEERGYILCEECFHDEHPPRPCRVIGHSQVPVTPTPFPL